MRREISQLSELEKYKTKKYLLNTGYCCTEAHRSGYQSEEVHERSGDLEDNRMFTTEPSQAYSQWDGDKVRTAPPRD